MSTSRDVAFGATGEIIPAVPSERGPAQEAQFWLGSHSRDEQLPADTFGNPDPADVSLAKTADIADLNQALRRNLNSARGLSVVLLTLTTMKLTALAGYLLVVAEFTFVACFLGNEIMRFALRDRITCFERFAHSIPERRYQSQFSVPLNTVLAGSGAGAGAGLVASIHDGLLVHDLGLAVLIATIIPFGRLQLDVAAGIAPRPVARARFRGLLSDADRRLTAEMKLSPDEVMAMRMMLTRINRVGDRIAGQQDSWRWRDAIQRERRLFTATVALTTLFAVVVGLLAAIHLARGDHRALPALVIASLLVAADLAGMLLRRSRCRREQHDLGVELSSVSTRLLARLATIPAPNSPTAPVARIVSRIQTFTRKWLRDPRARLP